MIDAKHIVIADEIGGAWKDGRYPGRFLLGDYTVTHNTATVQSVLSGVMRDQFNVVSLNCSARTTSHRL
jgi:hypothetical protein